MRQLKSIDELDNNPKDTLSIRARLDAAHKEIAALCLGEGRPGGKRWRMSIPIMRDDSDMVLTAPLHDVEYLLAENARQLVRIAQLERENADLKKDVPKF